MLRTCEEHNCIVCYDVKKCPVCEKLEDLIIDYDSDKNNIKKDSFDEVYSEGYEKGFEDGKKEERNSNE